MRHVWILIVLAGCMEPGAEPPATGTSDGGQHQGEVPYPHQPMQVEPPAMPERTSWLEAYNGSWGRPTELVAHGEATVRDGLIELGGAILDVHLRTAVPMEDVTISAWSAQCCYANAWTQFEQQGMLSLPPGLWHIEAHGIQNGSYIQDALVLRVGLEWTVNGTVWPAPADLPGHGAADEIRLATQGMSGAITLRLATSGDVRDVRLGLQQGGWMQCSDPPRPGALATHRVFLEGHLPPETRTARIFVGDVPDCQGAAIPLNADAAPYVLQISV